MNSTIVVGSQWGDEGKGKVVDYLAGKSDMIVRFNGGNNAGHTVVVKGEKYKLSLLPSGVLYNKILCLAQGVVIDPEILVKEIDLFEKKLGRKLKLFIDLRCHMVMPYHKAWDAATEAWRGKAKVGSLHLGIGYTYSDRTNRFGVRLEDLMDPIRLKKALEQNYNIKKAIIEKAYPGKLDISLKAIYKAYNKLGKRLKPYSADVSLLVSQALKKSQNILFEGAQGAFLDLAFGTYPYTVACSTLAGAVFPAVGIGPQKMNVVGLVKAYTTRVGGGPFKTELFNAVGEDIRERGGEFGTVSKRPRRCGWLDLTMIRYALRINGFSQICLTKLDVLTGIKKIKICVGYKIKGKTLSREFPSLSDDFAKAQPVYQELLGWKEDISKIKTFIKLPKACQKYILFIEKSLGIPIKYISVGAERNALIKKLP